MRPFFWYLGANVTGLASNNIAAIENSSFDYYISHKPMNLTNYTEEINIDGVYLYKRIV